MARGKRTESRCLIRAAVGDDVADLANIRNVSRPAAESTSASSNDASDELEFIDRLSLPHGDDYFCIVAEDDGAVVGYLLGGGSRDLDRKAHGEIYEIAVLPGARRRGVGHALLGAALERCEAAEFAGTIFSAPVEDEAAARLASGLGMFIESELAPVRSAVRYERSFKQRVRP